MADYAKQVKNEFHTASIHLVGANSKAVIWRTKIQKSCFNIPLHFVIFLLRNVHKNVYSLHSKSVHMHT